MFGDRQKVCSVLQIKLNTSKAFNSMTTMLGSTSPYQWLLHFIIFIYQFSQSSSEATILFRFMRAVTMGSFVWTTSLWPACWRRRPMSATAISVTLSPSTRTGTRRWELSSSKKSNFPVAIVTIWWIFDENQWKRLSILSKCSQLTYQSSLSQA